MKDLEHIRKQIARVADPIAMLEGIFAYAPVGLQVYRTDGHCLLTNRAFRELFGSEPPPEYNVLEDELAAERGILDLVRRAFAGEVVEIPAVWYDPREQPQVQVPEGRRVAVAATFFPLLDRDGRVGHVAAVFKDQTAEKLALEEAERERANAKQESELLRLVIEQGGNGVIVTDERGFLRIFNPEAERQHGVGMQEVAPPAWAEAYGLETLEGDPLPLEETPLYRALCGERVDGAHWLVRRPDGSIRTLAGTATPLTRPDGTPAGAVLISRDETERLHLEEELQKAISAREDFLSIAAHELRTPMTTLKLQAESLVLLAEDGKPVAPEKFLEKAKAVERQTVRLERLIEGLLDVSRLLAGRLDLRPEPLDLVGLAAEAAERLGKDAGATSPIAVRSEGPVPGRWDRMRLEQVITNLLSNAIQYGKGKPIEISVQSVGGRALFSVRDHGIGIPLEDQKRIFGRFERAQPRRHPGGLGLGLWIVRQIVEMMGGSVSVQSEPGAGSTFTVNLPKTAPPAIRLSP